MSDTDGISRAQTIMYRLRLDGDDKYEWYQHDWKTDRVTVLNDITGHMGTHAVRRDQWGYQISEKAGVDLTGLTPYAYTDFRSTNQWILCDLEDDGVQLKHADCPECEGHGEWEQVRGYDRRGLGGVSPITRTVYCEVCEGDGNAACDDCGERPAGVFGDSDILCKACHRCERLLALSEAVELSA